jgi:type IV secretory pathway VirB2 component (pilin)
MKTQYAILGLFFVLMTINLVSAVDFNQPISDADKASFDQMLEPVLKVYNLVKYVSSVIAVVILLFAGITYMTSGSDPGKRERAKNMAMYVVIGLFVIWAAPLVVNFIIGS